MLNRHAEKVGSHQDKHRSGNSNSGQLAITQEATYLPTRMIKATIAANTASSTEHNLPMVQPAGQVEVDGRLVDLDAPPKPIPNLWL